MLCHQFPTGALHGICAATKHALQGSSVSLDHELRGTGLRSLAVRPGFMRSSIGQNTDFASDLGGNAVKVRQAVEKSLEMADDPNVVAIHVLRLLEASNPLAITDAGKEAKLLRRLSTVLPTRLFERSFRKKFGLPWV